MNGIFVSCKKEKNEYIQKTLCLEKLFFLNIEEFCRFSIKEDTIIICDLKNEEDNLLIEEKIEQKYPLICIYNRSNHYPFEQYSNTIFIPSEYTLQTLKEAFVRINSFNIQDDETLIGSSLKMDNVRAAIRRYAKRNCSIHLSGNTGTGKNVAAKMIHSLSGKKNKMVYVNCGTCSNPGLIESNFFGYSKGSFTGSSGTRNGYLLNADKSTLFLDEIENMSHYMQELLLDTIDSGNFRRVGSDTEINSDFRIITASNVNLEELIEKGKLRLDFYYRIAQREIHLPNLDEHKEDIPELVQYYERKNNIIRYRITNYEPLFNRLWPGNIRELFKVISIMHEEIELNSSYSKFRKTNIDL